jgi:hypothetical protein
LGGLPEENLRIEFAASALGDDVEKMNTEILDRLEFGNSVTGEIE